MNQQKKVWEIFSSAPHRMMFLAGAVQLFLTLIFWTVELSGRYTSFREPLELTLPSTSIHIFLMIYSIFPFFIFGFLMTTYPRWMEVGSISRKSYVSTFCLQVGGLVLFYLGLFAGHAVLLGGVALHLAGWIVGVLALLRVYGAAKGSDRYHPRHLNVALSFGLAGEVVYFIFLLTPSEFLLRLSFLTGFWLFLMPLVWIVPHRILPFFSSRVLENYTMVRPQWTLPSLWIGLAAHLVIEVSEVEQFLFIVDLPLLFIGLYHSHLWGLGRSLSIRLLAVLHISLFWFSIGMALYVVQSLGLLITGDLLLGKGPLHALAIGFLVGMVLSMGTRVSLGHSGRPLNMDLFSWICFGGIQLSALLRILAEVEFPSSWLPINLNLLAALVWLLFIFPWGIRYGSFYLKPRVDGQEG